MTKKQFNKRSVNFYELYFYLRVIIMRELKEGNGILNIYIKHLIYEYTKWLLSLSEADIISEEEFEDILDKFQYLMENGISPERSDFDWDLQKTYEEFIRIYNEDFYHDDTSILNSDERLIPFQFNYLLHLDKNITSLYSDNELANGMYYFEFRYYNRMYLIMYPMILATYNIFRDYCLDHIAEDLDVIKLEKYMDENIWRMFINVCEYVEGDPDDEISIAESIKIPTPISLYHSKEALDFFCFMHIKNFAAIAFTDAGSEDIYEKLRAVRNGLESAFIVSEATLDYIFS